MLAAVRTPIIEKGSQSVSAIAVPEDSDLACDQEDVGEAEVDDTTLDSCSDEPAYESGGCATTSSTGACFFVMLGAVTWRAIDSIRQRRA